MHLIGRGPSSNLLFSHPLFLGGSGLETVVERVYLSEQ